MGPPRFRCGQGLGFHFPAEEFEDFWKQIVFSNSPWQGEPIASFRFQFRALSKLGFPEARVSSSQTERCRTLGHREAALQN